MPRRINNTPLLLLVAHVMRRGRRGSTAIVMTARALGLGGDADRLLLAHVVRDLGLRVALIMMAVLLSVGAGLRHRGKRDERQGGSSGKNFADRHTRFSIVTFGRQMSDRGLPSI